MDNNQPLPSQEVPTTTTQAVYDKIPDDMSRHHRLSKRNKRLGIVALVLLCVLGVLLMVKQFGKSPVSLFEPTYQLDQPVAKVGEETLYFADVVATAKADNYAVFGKEDRAKYINSSSNLIMAYFNKTIDDSILLQEGKVAHLVEDFPKDIFNLYKKNHVKRQKIVTDIIKAANRNIESINVDVITLYYTNNTSSPSAKTAMDGYRSQIAADTLTFTQVGQKIASDSSLVAMAQLNKNAYVSYKDLSRNQILFKNQTIQNQLFSQRVNTVSPVIAMVTSFRNPLTGTYETRTVGYTFFRVLTHKPGNTQNFAEWLSSIRQKYSIERKI